MARERDKREEPVDQARVIRALTMEQRWRVAESLYATAREWKACALRSLRPDWDEAAIREAVRRSFLHARR